ncbi:MAG: hypothetical protein HRT58_00020 [Crocinitomicaceae bacterium]|nr:hypothetical protein [Flavobacteriales bacterium]NQZ34005.1 hypothetical protein [Crocinitomicaceae bacterium]
MKFLITITFLIFYVFTGLSQLEAGRKVGIGLVTGYKSYAGVIGVDARFEFLNKGQFTTGIGFIPYNGVRLNMGLGYFTSKEKKVSFLFRTTYGISFGQFIVLNEGSTNSQENYETMINHIVCPNIGIRTNSRYSFFATFGYNLYLNTPEIWVAPNNTTDINLNKIKESSVDGFQVNIGVSYYFNPSDFKRTL